MESHNKWRLQTKLSFQLAKLNSCACQFFQLLLFSALSEHADGFQGQLPLLSLPPPRKKETFSTLDRKGVSDHSIEGGPETFSSKVILSQEWGWPS